jgi:magnesium transporter
MSARSRRRRTEAKIRRRIHRQTTPPGTLIAEPDALPSRIRVMAFGPDSCTEAEIKDTGEIPQYLEQWPVTWVNVDGLADADLIQRLGELFGLHRLALEDVLQTHQRPKFEQYSDRLFIVVRMTECPAGLDIEQFSLFLGPRFILTFQEDQGDVLDTIRQRIRSRGGRVCGHGADYLAYAILDAIVDAYFPVLEQYAERLEVLEDKILTRPRHSKIAKIHVVKRDLLVIRKAIWPMRDAIGQLMRDDSHLITADTRTYLRDCYDHTVQLIDLEESLRELVAGLMDLHLNNVSTRLNDVMKLLTIIATIFMPLTLIAGIYGMNFVHMPGLTWRWGFHASIFLMAAIAIVMVAVFWRRGWLTPASRQLADTEEGQVDPK